MADLSPNLLIIILNVNGLHFLYVIFSQRHGEQISGCQDLGKVEGGE